MRGAPGSAEAGETLLEILIAVAILGICFAAVLAGLGTSVRVSGIHHQSAYEVSYLRALAESVQKQAYDDCNSAPPSTYSTAGIAPSGYALSVSVKHLNGGSFSTTCPATDELQEVTLTVSPPDDRAATRSLVVIKRKP